MLMQSKELGERAMANKLAAGLCTAILLTLIHGLCNMHAQHQAGSH